MRAQNQRKGAQVGDGSGAAILGGQLVEAAAGGRIQKAGAASVKVLGVALNDAIAPEDLVTGATTGSDGRPVVSAAVLPTIVAVASSGAEVPGLRVGTTATENDT